MNVLEIPFHKHLGIVKATSAEYIFALQEEPAYLNHLGNIHACVQLSLAEACSGEFLLHELYEHRNNYVPVIRKTEVKYHKPANGTLYAKAAFTEKNKEMLLQELQERKRATLPIKAELYNEEKVKVLTALFEWFIAAKPNT